MKHRSPHLHSSAAFSHRVTWRQMLGYLLTFAACLHISTYTPITTAASIAADPALTAVTPNIVNTGQPTTLTIAAGGFVAPITVLVRKSHLPFETLLTDVTIVNSTTITGTLPAMTDEGSYDIEIQGSDGVPHYLFAALSVAYQGDGRVGPWVAANSLPTKRAGLGTVMVRDQIYILGGRELNDPFNIVERATLGADGTIGPWTFAKSMITPRDNFAVASTDKAIYALGGRQRASSSALASVEWAVVHPDGSLGDWQTAPALLSGHSDFAAVVVGNYLYSLGGNMNGSAAVERAAIGVDGALGAWEQMPSMTTGRANFAAVAVQGYIYALGGLNSAGASSVERVQVKPDGSLGTWELISRMTTARSRLNAVAAHGYLYAIGGTSAIICSNTVERAALALDGSLGTWEKVASMRLPRCGFGIVFANERLFALGGEEDGFPSDQVEQARLVTYTQRSQLALILR